MAAQRWLLFSNHNSRGNMVIFSDKPWDFNMFERSLCGVHLNIFRVSIHHYSSLVPGHTTKRLVDIQPSKRTSQTPSSHMAGTSPKHQGVVTGSSRDGVFSSHLWLARGEKLLRNFPIVGFTTKKSPGENPDHRKIDPNLSFRLHMISWFLYFLAIMSRRIWSCMMVSSVSNAFDSFDPSPRFAGQIAMWIDKLPHVCWRNRETNLHKSIGFFNRFPQVRSVL